MATVTATITAKAQIQLQFGIILHCGVQVLTWSQGSRLLNLSPTILQASTRAKVLVPSRNHSVVLVVTGDAFKSSALRRERRSD